jgi:hypothetical protein
MATRKKTTHEADALKPAETVPATPNTVRSRKAAAPQGGSEKASAKPNSPAATHKAPARKPMVEETLAVHAAGERPSFDAALHHEEISKEAYCRWLRRGCAHGSAREDWLAAVALVRARHTR